MSEKEMWKPIKGYEGVYEISNLGRVKTLARQMANRRVPEKIRKPNFQKGYSYVLLRKDGEGKGFRIHRLVAETFIGEPPSPEYQVNHIDGDKSNNCVDNLEWVTPKQNTHHSFETGLRKTSLSEETKKKIGEKSRELWKRSEYREFQSKMAKELWADAETHRKRSAAIKEGIRRAKENGTYRSKGGGPRCQGDR